MKKTPLSSECYSPPHIRRRVYCLALFPLLSVQVMADTVYRWTDAAGVTHFSDTAPPLTSPDRRKVEIAPVRATGAQGLRPGERAILEKMEEQLTHTRHKARQARQRNDRAVAEHRRECRERRARQRGSGYHATRKDDATYLRRNCW